MNKKITLTINKIIFSLSLLLVSSFSFAQLAAGDIAFVGMNSDTDPNELSIVTLNVIAAGQTIIITDYGYNGASLDQSNTTAEGYITWNTTKTIAAGTIIKFTVGFGHTIGGQLTDYGAVTAVGWSGDAIASGGDNWFILQGSLASPTFIYAYANWSTPSHGVKTWVVNGAAISATTSCLPSTLINGTTANIQSGDPAYHFDNNVYTGSKTGSKAAVLAALANSSNWSGDEVVQKDIAAGGTNFPGANPIFTVAKTVNITAQPANSTVCSGANTSFEITVSGAIGYYWEVDMGSGFVAINDGSPYSGASTAKLSISNSMFAMNGYMYRCVAYGEVGAISNSATLTVNKTNAPTGDASQTAMTTGTLADLVVSGTSIKWYSAAVSGTFLPNSTVVTVGTTYHASQTSTSTSCESEARLAVKVTARLANTDFEQIAFSFYPNPVIDLFTVKSDELIKEITVYSSLGQVVFNKKTNDFDVSIDLSSLVAGHYYVTLTSENSFKNIKIIKK